MLFSIRRLIVAIVFIGGVTLTAAPPDVHSILAAIRSGDTATALANLNADFPVDQPVGGDGTTLLHNAARKDDTAVVERLIELGASPATRDNQGQSPLHHLAEAKTCSPRTLDLLLASGALLVDDLDTAARTPLHLAAARRNAPTAAAFLAAGADPSATAPDGSSPESIARQNNHRALVELFAGSPPPARPGSDRQPQPPRYPAADLSVPLFDSHSLTLPQQDRDEAVSELVALARNHPDSAFIDHHLRARALAVALSINRRAKNAVVADAQLRLGITPRPLGSGSSILSIPPTLRRIATAAVAADRSRDDHRLASLLIEIAARIDPTISTVGFAAADWRNVFGSAPPPPTPPAEPLRPAPPLPIQAASIRSVALAPSPPSTYAVVDISSTARPRPPHAPTTAARFTSPNANSLAPALAAARALAPWPQGYQLTLSLPPEVPAADANAAGSAVALLATSHVRSQPLDPNIVVIADVAANGELVSVGQLQERLRRALDSGCKTAIVAAGAIPELTDAVTLGSTDLVRDIQLLVAPDLATAFDMATASPPYASASTEFLLVQALTQSGRISTQEAVSRLRAVAASAPGHLSATLLVAAASGRLPKQLSPKTSAEKIRTLAALLTNPIDSKRGFPLPAQFVPERLDDISSTLTRHRALLAPDTRPAADATNDLAALLSKYLDNPPRSGDGQRKMATALRDATAHLQSELAKLALEVTP